MPAMAEAPFRTSSPFPPLDPPLSPDATEAPTDTGPARVNRDAAEPGFHPQTPQDRFVDPHADHSEGTYATFNHLAGLLTFVNAGLPLMGAIATLVLWRIRRDRSPFLDDHGREAMNFQITLFIYFVVIISALLPSLGLALLGLPLMYALTLWGCIRGALAAHRGEYYRYPVTFRLLKADHERD